MDYRDLLKKKEQQARDICSSARKQVSEYLQSNPPEEINDLAAFKPINIKLNDYINMLSSTEVTIDIKDIERYVLAEYDDKISAMNKEKLELMESIAQKGQDLMNSKIAAVKQQNEEIRKHNEEVRRRIEEQNSVYQRLEAKRRLLEESAEDIISLCQQYGINTSDIAIDNSTFTPEELDVLYNDFIKYMRSKSFRGRNPITLILDKINYDAAFMGLIVVVFVVLMYSPLWDFLSIGVLLSFLVSHFRRSTLVKRYIVLAGLVFNIQPLSMGIEKEIDVNTLEIELSEDIDFDNDKEFLEFMEESNKKVEELDDSDIQQERSEALSKFMNEHRYLTQEINDLNTDLKDLSLEVIKSIKSYKERLNAREQELRSQIKPLGTQFKESTCLDTNVILGMNPDTMIYETVDVGNKNIIFNHKGNKQEDIENFIKLMLVNFMCNVRPGYLDVIIYDPNGMGRNMAGFLNDQWDTHIKIIHRELDKEVSDLQNYAADVLRITKGQNLSEYNKESEELGRKCLGYKILVILSQPKSVEENEALNSFMSYSAQQGVFVWMVSDSAIPNTFVFKYPFEGIKQPYEFNSFDLPIQTTENIIQAFEKIKTKGLMWKEFINRALPEDELWKGCADEFIELDVGFEGGDPSKFKPYTVGNTGDIHAVCVGGTGAGKSVFLNNLIANVCRKYPPNEVNLWLVDFKGVEFSKYLKNEAIGQNYILPHIQACLCTSDPDYSVSLFHALREFADARYKYLQKLGFVNMYKHNQAMRKEGTPEKCLPRTLCIVDEFNIIFEKTDAKARESLEKDITQIAKVARACGVHILFASQSMNNTIKDDILDQFTLRFGLRCSMSTSQAIMGTKLSGEIREKNGWLYVRSIDDKKLELQKLYKTPFIDADTETPELVEQLSKKAVDEHFKTTEPITYEETAIHNINELDKHYEELPSDKTNGLFLLGERMTYSNKGRISNIIMSRSMEENLVSVFSVEKDGLMFFETLKRNLKDADHPYKAIYCSTIPDLCYLYGLDELGKQQPPLFQDPVADPTEIVDFLINIQDARKAVEDKDTLEPLYIFCVGWDKMVGVGIQPNYRLSDKLVKLVKTCGLEHMHFIFICSSLGELPKALHGACHYKVAGKCDERSSMSLLDSNAAYKSYAEENGYMFLWRSNRVERIKIYQSPLTRELKESELII